MLIAVDTNVLLDHTHDDDDVVDAVEAIHGRLDRASLVVTPTVLEELFALYEGGDSAERNRAGKALSHMRGWGYEPLNLTAVERGIAEQIGMKLRVKDILPDEEVNDGLVIAEAALLGSAILLTADSHMLDAQSHPLFRKVLRESDVDGDDIIIVTPREIVRKFFRSR